MKPDHSWWLSAGLLVALCSNAALLLVLIFDLRLSSSCCTGSRGFEPGTPTSGPSQLLVEEEYISVREDARVATGGDSNLDVVGVPEPGTAAESVRRRTGRHPDSLLSYLYATGGRRAGEDQDNTASGVNQAPYFETSSPLRSDASPAQLSGLFDSDDKHRRKVTSQDHGFVDSTKRRSDPTTKFAQTSTSNRAVTLDKTVLLEELRHKRDTNIQLDGGYFHYESAFSAISQDEKNNSTYVEDYGRLVPALVHFEDLMYKQLEELHFIMLSQDLRLERLEKAVLNLAGATEPPRAAEGGRRRGGQWVVPIQSDVLDSLAEISLTLRPVEEIEKTKMENDTAEVDTDGSGEGDGNVTFSSKSPATTTTTTTTTSTTTSTTTTTPPPPPTTTVKPVAYYDLLREMSEMEQKVLALENYNTMSDSELNRVRSEVTKMDDKVIEMRRRQKNIKSVTSHHTYKITELEMQMSRNDVALNTALDAYGRLTSRVEGFKDRLTDFKRDVHTVIVQYTRQEQISNELRSADSYKAHDIMELRKTMQGVESRLNDLYSHLDQNMDSVRNDFRGWLDRLCFNNKLAC